MMALRKGGFWGRLLGKSRDSADDRLAAEAVRNIVDSLETLSLKVGSLNGSYSEQKQGALSLVREARAFVPQNEIAAAKCEQSILGAVTAASSACDGVLAGGDGAEFRKQFAALAVLVAQRSHFTAD